MPDIGVIDTNELLQAKIDEFDLEYVDLKIGDKVVVRSDYEDIFRHMGWQEGIIVRKEFLEDEGFETIYIIDEKFRPRVEGDSKSTNWWSHLKPLDDDNFEDTSGSWFLDDSLMKYRKLPDYRSRRRRLNESIKYKYPELIYKMDNIDEYNEIIEFLDKNDYNILSTNVDIFPSYLFIMINTKTLATSINDNIDYDINYINIEVYPNQIGIDPKIYDKNTLYDFKFIVTRGIEPPSYKSRKKRI